MKNLGLIAILFLMIISSCSKRANFQADFDNINDRIWVGKDFWSIPLEEWRVIDGRLECNGEVAESRVNILTHLLSPDDGNFKISARMGLLKKSGSPGSAGFLLGIYDKEDPGAKAACYFGKSIKAGVSLKGFAFLNGQQVALPEGFDWDEFVIRVKGNNNLLSMVVVDSKGNSTEKLTSKIDGIQGLVAIANNIAIEKEGKPGESGFWFDDLKLSGPKVAMKQDNAFGPILWTTYTLSKNIVKLMAQMPPLGENDNQAVSLQLKKEGVWKTMVTKDIEPDSRTAIFKIVNWDDTQDTPFRVLYTEKGRDGSEARNYYEGTIRRDPVDKPLKVAGLTGQFYNSYPYSPLVENLKKVNPDFLYFSGDQIYESNGGYRIIREPVELSIVNYLGKYYMFGWAFGDLMRDRPTVCTSDDHDVYHGNLWGESGKHLSAKDVDNDDLGGFKQSVRMVNAVNRTQCGNLPDPYDPAPIGDGMSVWYTDITYGRVSFAVVSDRIFKSGPEAVSNWQGRKDHLIAPLKDPSQLIKPGLKMLGDRQVKFLEDWITDWDGADMKVLLTQTVFAGVATHHGSLLGYVYGDLDSGGWPKNGRDRAIRIMRKGFVFQIAGDQHLTSLVQYGVDDYRDAGWCFCTPAISVGYQRWFLPDKLGWEVSGRPGHGEPNTGDYEDAFGNKNFVYAIGNPDKQSKWDKRYLQAHKRSSGFGVCTFNKGDRTIKIDSWKFLAHVDNPNEDDQFPGWPVTISQMDNYGRKAVAYLPKIRVNKPNQLIRVIDGQGELVYVVRINGNSFHPKVFEKGNYSVIIGEDGSARKLKNVSAGSGGSIAVEL